VQAPLVLVMSQHGGRNAASNSKALEEWGDKSWISAFCDWLYSPATSTGKSLVVEDCSADPRCMTTAPFVCHRPHLQPISLES